MCEYQSVRMTVTSLGEKIRKMDNQEEVKGGDEGLPNFFWCEQWNELMPHYPRKDVRPELMAVFIHFAFVYCNHPHIKLVMINRSSSLFISWYLLFLPADIYFLTQWYRIVWDYQLHKANVELSWRYKFESCWFHGEWGGLWLRVLQNNIGRFWKVVSGFWGLKYACCLLMILVCQKFVENVYSYVPLYSNLLKTKFCLSRII